MAYVRKRKHYKLVFEDPEYAGLEVIARAGSVQTYQEIAKSAEAVAGRAITVADLATLDYLHAAFAAVLVSWNIEEEDGSPVPATYEGLRSAEPEEAQAIIMAWINVIADSVSGEGQALTVPIDLEALESDLDIPIAALAD